MASKTPETDARPVADKTAPTEPANVLVKTTRKQVKIRRAIVSGIPNFRITRTEADALVAAGEVTILEG